MKTFMWVLIVGLVVSPVFAEEIAVQVNGMVCSFCAQGITKKFKAQKSVEKVHVDLDKKIVNLTTKKDATLDEGTIKKVIKDAGYEVVRIDRK